MKKFAILLLLCLLLSPVEAQIIGRRAEAFPAKTCMAGLDMCVEVKGTMFDPTIIWTSPGGAQFFPRPTLNCQGSDTNTQKCWLTVNLND